MLSCLLGLMAASGSQPGCFVVAFAVCEASLPQWQAAGERFWPQQVMCALVLFSARFVDACYVQLPR